MTFEKWLLFSGAVFLLSATPGPTMLHVLFRSVELGFRQSLIAVAGCFSAVVVALVASMTGVVALLLAVPGAFDFVRYAGVAYLVYLGVKTWRSEVTPLETDAEALPRRTSALTLFRTGFAVNMSNPKLLLFAAAFLPQFVDPSEPKVPQFAVLAATFVATEVLWYTTYALGGRSIARYLTRPAIRRLFNRASGVMFVGFGLALLKVKPS